jgi:hypothetical protein
LVAASAFALASAAGARVSFEASVMVSICFGSMRVNSGW